MTFSAIANKENNTITVTTEAGNDEMPKEMAMELAKQIMQASAKLSSRPEMTVNRLSPTPPATPD